MARIAGVEIPDEKRVEISLTYVYGMGLPSSQKLLNLCNISPDKRTRDLTTDELARLRSLIEDQFVVEGELRKSVTGNIKRLREIKCYRGIRHAKGLPVRGQNTRTNARTRKGKRKSL